MQNSNINASVSHSFAALSEAGLCVLPALPAEKRPALPSWKPYQTRKPSPEEITGWQRTATGICVVTGAISDNLVVLDFDEGGVLFEPWRQKVDQECPGLLDTVYIESTPSGGKHVIFRTQLPPQRSRPYARRCVEAESSEPVIIGGKSYTPAPTASGGWQIVLTQIETRAEGSLCLCAPTPGYVQLSGSLADLPLLTETQLAVLLAVAIEFNSYSPPVCVPAPTAKPSKHSGQDRPGDRFNESGDVVAVLRKAGWKLFRDGVNQQWTRPGKEFGTSATLRDRVFYVFSSNAAPFAPDRGYAPFSVYALLEHGGDFAAAARAVANHERAREGTSKRLEADREVRFTLRLSDGQSDTAGLPALNTDEFQYSLPDEQVIRLPGDIGNARRLVNRYGAVVRHFTQRKAWLVWDGTRWKSDDTGKVMQYAKDVALQMTSDLQKGGSGLDSKWVSDSRKHERLRAMISLAAPDVAVTADRLDADSWLFNCENGTIDLRTGELLPHDPSRLITKLAPVRYEADAQCPLFMRFLNEVFCGDVELIEFVQRFLGHCLTGEISEQYLPIFYGEGGNGKSVLLDTVAALMGDYAATAPPSLLTVKRNEEHPTEIADLVGRRLVIASETEQGAELRMQLLKRLTGDRHLKARFMRHDFFEFARTHKTILVTNNLPVVREDTEAVWRRLRCVPFNYVVPVEKRDPKLLSKLRDESAGILRWLVQGCQEWRRNGLPTASAITIVTNELRDSAGGLDAFIEETCVRQVDGFVPSARLLDSYEKWCEARNVTPVRGRAWGAALHKIGCRDDKYKMIRGWFGISMRDGGSECHSN
ncbi:MAG TPA: phage/plasmid primase, P4 family [Phycisphaerales bacterium]|nr:phage/plasmid primase, P4 family [Phycisphaerales bacterium]